MNNDQAQKAEYLELGVLLTGDERSSAAYKVNCFWPPVQNYNAVQIRMIEYKAVQDLKDKLDGFYKDPKKGWTVHNMELISNADAIAALKSEKANQQLTIERLKKSLQKIVKQVREEEALDYRLAGIQETAAEALKELDK